METPQFDELFYSRHHQTIKMFDNNEERKSSDSYEITIPVTTFELRKKYIKVTQYDFI